MAEETWRGIIIDKKMEYEFVFIASVSQHSKCCVQSSNPYANNQGSLLR